MAPPKKKRPLVSSNHLATGQHWPLSEFEFGLTVVNNAFQKWIVKCAAAAGQETLSALDVLVFHNINHRNSAKRRIDICFMLNIEDSHTVNYSLKRLVKLGLIQGTKRGKEIFYKPTDAGLAFCQEYKAVREQCLLSGFKADDTKNAEELSFIADMLRSLSGQYDQAARTAASL